MSTPPLLKTYEDARLLFEAKGWELAKVAAHFSEMPEMARFHISHTKLSRKSRGKFPIEPEVAAAVESLKTWIGHERKTEIVIKGLLALHGDPSIVDVGQVAADLREQLPAGELAPKLVEALEQKAGDPSTVDVGQEAADLREQLPASELAPKLVEALEQKAGDPSTVDVGQVATDLGECLPAGELAPKLMDALEQKAGEALEQKTGDQSTVDVGQVAADLREQLPASEPAPKPVEALEQKAGQRAMSKKKIGRAFWKRIAITAGSAGALVGCLVVLLGAPLLPSQADAAQPGPPVLIVYNQRGDKAWRLDPRSLLDDMPANWGEKPLDQTVPDFTLPGQKVAPCNAALGEVAINGNCWANQGDVKPPCGLLFRHGDKCYRPIAAEPKKPAP